MRRSPRGETVTDRPSSRRDVVGSRAVRPRSDPVSTPARGGIMAAVDDLTELVERAAAAEKSALASKWKDESDVQGLIRRTRRTAEEQRQAVSMDIDPDRLSPRWAGLQQNYLDLGAQPALPGQEPSAGLDQATTAAIADDYGKAQLGSLKSAC